MALPPRRHANAAGGIFQGWTLSQMDVAGGTFAADRSGKRVVTVRIEAVDFLKPVSVGGDVGVFCTPEEEVWAKARAGGEPHKVTADIFRHIAFDADGKPAEITG